MPVIYDIFPELNLVIYVCTDTITTKKFFEVGDQVALDPRFRAKMNIIIDIFDSEIETSVSDISYVIQKNEETKRSGKELGKTAVFTKSTALRFLGDTIQLLSAENISPFGFFYNQADLFKWLNIPQKTAQENWDALKERVQVI